MATPFCRARDDIDAPSLGEARQIVRAAGYGVDSDFDTGTVKVEGYAPMTASAFLQFANGLRARRRVG